MTPEQKRERVKNNAYEYGMSEIKTYTFKREVDEFVRKKKLEQNDNVIYTSSVNLWLQEYAESYLKQWLEDNTPSDEEIEKESSDYGKRAYYGHFVGEEPEYHYKNGAESQKQKLLNKVK